MEHNGDKMQWLSSIPLETSEHPKNIQVPQNHPSSNLLLQTPIPYVHPQERYLRRGYKGPVTVFIINRYALGKVSTVQPRHTPATCSS